MGDWGLGIGDWGLGPIPNPQTPIPNPPTPNPNTQTLYIIYKKIFKKKNIKIIILKINI